jgi:flavin reductase (DIM6/NTAB) family NADH-FMN oxidoreductase RutF
VHLCSGDIAALGRRHRAALINSLSGFKSANLVGTADPSGDCNLAIMSSAVHVGASPPLLGLVIRPGGAERHTLHNLLSTGAFSVNHVSEAIVEAAHQTSARYPPGTSEFEASGLTAEWWQGFAAPMVAEAPVKLALELRSHQLLDINQTHFVIGEIVQIEAPDGCCHEDGSLDLAATGSIAVSGLDSYHRPGLFKRMAYAKPDLPPRVIATGEEAPS